MATRSEFFRGPLPAGAVAAVLEVLTRDRVAGGGARARLHAVGRGLQPGRCRHDRVRPSRRDVPAQALGAVHPDAPDRAKDAALAFVRRSWETVHPWGSGGVFPAFPDRDLAKPAEAYYGSNLPRLRTIKARYDPTNVFQPPSGQAIPPD